MTSILTYILRLTVYVRKNVGNVRGQNQRNIMLDFKRKNITYLTELKIILKKRFFFKTFFFDKKEENLDSLRSSLTHSVKHTY